MSTQHVGHSSKATTTLFKTSPHGKPQYSAWEQWVDVVLITEALEDACQAPQTPTLRLQQLYYAATMREEAAPAVVPAGAARAALPTGMSV